MHKRAVLRMCKLTVCRFDVYHSYIIYNGVRVCVYNAEKSALVAVALSYRSNIGVFGVLCAVCACILYHCCSKPSRDYIKPSSNKTLSDCGDVFIV